MAYVYVDTAPFGQVPKTKQVVLTAACALGLANAPTNTVQLCTNDALKGGGLLTSIVFTPRASVLASCAAYIFSSPDGGTNQYILGSITIPQQTVSADAGIQSTSWVVSEAAMRRMGAGDTIWVGVSKALAAGVVADAQFTDY